MSFTYCSTKTKHNPISLHFYFRYGEFIWDRYVTPNPDEILNGIVSPTMSGGIMAIKKDYFFELGGYDTGMILFGGESLEFSFLVWMCGGNIKVIR